MNIVKIEREEFYLAKRSFTIGNLQYKDCIWGFIFVKNDIIKILYPKNKRTKRKITTSSSKIIASVSNNKFPEVLDKIKENSVLITKDELMIKDIIE